MKSKINDVKWIDIPKITDPRGNLAVVEKHTLPFAIKRVYYLYDVPSDASRGGHAHKKLLQVLVAVSGSFEVIIDDGEQRKKILLNKPNKALFIPNGIWREIENFSSGSVCLSLVSDEFSEVDYIRDYDDFLAYFEVKM
ncbi:dTDP-4-dehydrorhamnose 3,5-epimerase-like enzyme [Mesonia hippocampi]|uniref:dTDP-4-dehydrorhamnose 3,5-epimerase-like enzyme n=1 Tax=Mesonia hippocampi TaxID=1628250 RepID=A0A840EPE8_9FLAO|nr:FdtA/QdtA family cupin domain-containing protein [Mesonia hippocampi]MBB4118965.1 dTDP-4-dehydrorhamnose 3,5-epimerase-like enzyme [Mesonia hippocampi]